MGTVSLAPVSAGLPWIVSGVPEETPHGGPLRAHHLFAELTRLTGARVVPQFGGRLLPSALLGWHLQRARLASTQLIRPSVLRILRTRLQPAALDLHDHPTLHLDALGLSPDSARRRSLDDIVARNVAAFRWIVVQSARFADLAGIAPSQRLTIPNGTDTGHIRAGPLPAEPVVATLSGAAPGRGLELLVEAGRLLHEDRPEAALRLALAVTGPASRAYLDRLRRETAGLPWLEISEVPYPRLSEFLAGVRIIALPHPPHPYWDAILPIKLFDGLASGRPLATTPRTETANLLRAEGAGLVADGDRPEDLASAIGRLLDDDGLARELGERARQAAETRYDWRILSANLARALLEDGGALESGT